MTVPVSDPNDANAHSRPGAALGDAVRRAQQGDVDAFEVIYRAEMPAIIALARRMLGGDDSAVREAVQDVFVRAWERLPSFRGDSALGTWLHRLAINVLLERLRIDVRDSSRFVDHDDDSTVVPTARANDSAAASLDTRLDLEAAAARLPAGARSVWLLHDVMGYSHDEIAEITGIAAGTSRAQLWRARRTLTRLLDA
ncbi:MAG: RNA polymerase sigma factor [Gemmatimonadaceae bacterium]